MKLPFATPFDDPNFNWRRWAYLRRYFLFAAAILLLSIIIIFAAVIPQFFGDLELTNKLQDERQVLLALKNKVDALQKSLFLNTPENNRRVNLALPSEKPLLQLLSTTNIVAQNAQVSLGNIETSPGSLATMSGKNTEDSFVTSNEDAFLPKSTAKDIKTLVINVTVNGSLAQINSFIQQMEQSTPLINISQIALTSQDAGTGSDVPYSQAKFQAKLNLTTYYFVQPISVLVDTPLPKIGAKEQALLQNLNAFQFPEIQKQQQIQGGGLNDLFGGGNNQLQTLNSASDSGLPQ